MGDVRVRGTSIKALGFAVNASGEWIDPDRALALLKLQNAA